MERRDFIRLGVGGLVGSMVPSVISFCGSDSPVYCGWTPNSSASASFIKRLRSPYLMQQVPKAFPGSGKDKVVLLYKYLEAAIGEFISHDQKLGDCVGQSYGLATDLLCSTRIHKKGFAEKWVAKASTEVAYAGSRYEIGLQVHGNTQLIEGSGSLGAYCAEFLRDYGVLPRGKYGNIDLTHYNPAIAQDWGTNGIPDELEPIIKQHPIQSIALVRSYKECRDAIANGYPVVFCSNVGFNPRCVRHNRGGRDQQGFLKACGSWMHAMAGIAVDDTTRPGILVQNSWGPHWTGGGKRHGQPDGSFWVDAQTIDQMCFQGDSFSISGFIGFPMQRLDYNLF
jgi:hypothetical protein